MDTKAALTGQLTFGTTEQLQAWLESPEAPDNLSAAAQAVVTALAEIDKASNAGGGPPLRTRAYGLVQRHYKKCQIDFDVLDQAIDERLAEIKAADDAREAAERARRLEQDAIRAAAREAHQKKIDQIERAKKRHAEQVKKIMARTGLSDRQARRLMYGTSDPTRAKQLADILGGDAIIHYRPKARSGRPPNLPAHLMRARAYDVGFRDYVEQGTVHPGPLFEALYVMGGDRTDDYRGLDDFLATAAERKVESDVAHILWLNYLLWRNEAVAAATEAQLQERIDRLYDFG